MNRFVPISEQLRNLFSSDWDRTGYLYFRFLTTSITSQLIILLQLIIQFYCFYELFWKSYSKTWNMSHHPNQNNLIMSCFYWRQDPSSDFRVKWTSTWQILILNQILFSSPPILSKLSAEQFSLLPQHEEDVTWKGLLNHAWSLRLSECALKIILYYILSRRYKKLVQRYDKSLCLHSG